ncbi:hypothetical protein GCM10010191_76810 [Actinomadura vinacea]|uniref:HTH tetR-type domain-containing protein n=1 Tax=Actinomadura vinacea TaxID=115336 RepID=A0ABN3K6M5_9ACTN
MVTSGSTDVPSRPGGKAARTRRLLQRCTLDVIAETGEFTGEVVAERAGVSTATFYAHFATKDHAIEACLAVCFEEYEERMRRVESIEHLLDAGLEATLAAIVTTITRLNEEYRALLRLARARIQASHLLRDQSRSEEHRAFAATLRFVQLGQAAGRIRAGDPEVLTATMRTVVEGLDSWTIRAHPGVAEREVPELLSRYLSPPAP